MRSLTTVVFVVLAALAVPGCTEKTALVRDNAPAAEPYNEFRRIAEGHAYMWRLVCPDGSSVKTGVIVTSSDSQDRFIDDYEAICPEIAKTFIRVLPVGPMPEPPAGFRLLDPSLATELRGMEKSVGSDPGMVIRRTTGLLEILPGVHKILDLRAQAFYEIGDFRSALADWDAIIRTNPDPWYRLCRAAMLQRLGKNEAALNAARETRKMLDSKAAAYPDYLCEAGIMIMRGDVTEGTTAITEACSLKAEKCCRFLRKVAPEIHVKDADEPPAKEVTSPAGSN